MQLSLKGDIEMMKVEKREMRIVWAVSIGLALAILLTDFLIVLPNVRIKPMFDDFVIFSVIVATFPTGTLDYLNRRWQRAVEARLPDFLRDIAHSQRTGMTLIRAVEESAKREYGPLTKELRKVVAQMSWGVSFDEALESFANRIGTPLTRRSILLILETSRSGGDVERIMDQTASYVRSLQDLDRERYTETRPYILITYAAFFVFLFTVIMLLRTFFYPIAELSEKLAGGGPLALSITAAEQYKTIFFHMSMVQAFFGGLIAGKMGEAAIGAGLKHCVILLVIGYLAFSLIA